MLQTFMTFKSSLFTQPYFFLAGNPFPSIIRTAAVAQHDDTFYLVGGYKYDYDIGAPVYFDTIYRYEASSESWRLMPNRMKYGEDGVTAMIVNSSIFPTCD